MSLDQEALDQLAMMEQQEEKKPLLEFRAGILEQKGKTVTADDRRGKVQFVMADGLLTLKWLLRPSEVCEKTITLMPSCARWEKVDECKDGRVYVLKLTDSGRKHFFWMQEPKADQDEKWAKQINDYIANPPAGQSSGQNDELQQLLAEQGDIDPEVLQAMLGAQGLGAPSRGTSAASSTPAPPAASSSRPAPSSSAAPSTASRPAASNIPGVNDLAAQIAAMMGSSMGQTGQNNPQYAALRALAEAQANQLQLTDVMDADRIISLVNEDSKMIDQLLPLLPEGQRDRANLIATLRSPQFQSTVSRLSQMLNSENFAQVMASFALPLSSSSLGVEAFLDAIQKQQNDKKK